MGGWGDINIHIDINMNIHIHIIINMNIEILKGIIYYLLGFPYWAFPIGYSLLAIPYVYMYTLCLLSIRYSPCVYV